MKKQNYFHFQNQKIAEITFHFSRKQSEHVQRTSQNTEMLVPHYLSTYPQFMSNNRVRRYNNKSITSTLSAGERFRVVDIFDSGFHLWTAQRKPHALRKPVPVECPC